MVDKHSHWISGFKKIAVYEITELYPKEGSPRHERVWLYQILLSYSRPLTPPLPHSVPGDSLAPWSSISGVIRKQGRNTPFHLLKLPLEPSHYLAKYSVKVLKGTHISFSASPHIDIILTVDPESQTASDLIQRTNSKTIMETSDRSLDLMLDLETESTKRTMWKNPGERIFTEEVL